MLLIKKTIVTTAVLAAMTAAIIGMVGCGERPLPGEEPDAVTADSSEGSGSVQGDDPCPIADHIKGISVVSLYWTECVSCNGQMVARTWGQYLVSDTQEERYQHPWCQEDLAGDCTCGGGTGTNQDTLCGISKTLVKTCQDLAP